MSRKYHRKELWQHLFVNHGVTVTESELDMIEIYAKRIPKFDCSRCEDRGYFSSQDKATKKHPTGWKTVICDCRNKKATP